MQASTIPHAIEGKDILATAQTGTGKTLAFLIPIAEHLLKLEASGQKFNGIVALVLVPTRELGIQVAEQYNLLRGKRLAPPALVIGGTPEKKQIHDLRTAQLVVATPGRLEDFLSRGIAKLNTVKILVLDEADRMLDMGFIPAIRRIVSKLPKARQTMCFSATLEASVVHLIDDYLKKPVRLSFGSTSKPNSSVELHAYEVATNQRLALLERLLTEDGGRSLVFARTKRNTERLAKQLIRDGFSAGMIHGDRSQGQRNAALADFQEGRIQILVATDVASRGIHVDDVSHVINYELPELAEDLIHRVGRTGRAGATGKASVFYAAQDRREFAQIERTLGIKMEKMTVDGELAVEQRPGPVQVTGKAVPASAGSKMMRLPGEVLQRHQPQSV